MTRDTFKAKGTPPARDADGEVVAWIHRDDLTDLANGRDRKDAPAFSSLAAVSEEFRDGMVALYSTPPASVPVAELVALAEKWRREADEIAANQWTCNSNSIRARADELTALAQK
jgi:hypothetical protein